MHSKGNIIYIARDSIHTFYSLVGDYQGGGT